MRVSFILSLIFILITKGFRFLFNIIFLRKLSLRERQILSVLITFSCLYLTNEKVKECR